MVLVAVHLEDCPEAVALGAASIASALRRAFPRLPVHLVETFVNEGAQAIVKKIRERLSQTEEVVAVGFSVYSWNRALMIEAAQILRTENSKIFLFCGGPEISARACDLLCCEGGPFDVIIKGEGEEEAVRILGERFFNAAPSKPKGISDLAQASSPWLDGTLEANEHHGVLWELARGCPYSCAYCYESKGSGAKQVRYVSQERIKAELALFVQKKVPYIFVLDPTFNINDKRAIEILDMIAQERYVQKTSCDTHWHFELRAELLNNLQAQRFAKIGASLQIGLQTVNPKSLALIGRGNFNKNKFESKIKILLKHDIAFGLDIIYGLPCDTFSGYKESLDFSLSLYPNNLDMFRLSVLPGTLLFDKASEFGLCANADAPYDVISTRDFPAADLCAAEQLSHAADKFYNKGRAVAWFNQVLHPLKMKPSEFLEGFVKFCNTNDSTKNDNCDIEKLQLAYLDIVYTKAKKKRLLSAVQDIVRFNGAWGRALADGTSTDISFQYDPDEVLSGASIESIVAYCKKSPAKFRVQPGKPMLKLQ
jgi:radical SAM superfamily enzyme YgiQ (UPF0313 family)